MREPIGTAFARIRIFVPVNHQLAFDRLVVRADDQEVELENVQEGIEGLQEEVEQLRADCRELQAIAQLREAQAKWYVERYAAATETFEGMWL